jgi:spore maturation protein CgeB
MLILYVASKYDYGKPQQGYSFEHYNFYDALVNMGQDVLYFDFLTLLKKRGRRWMNRRLVEISKVEKPQLLFSVLFHDEIDKKSMKEISENTETPTLNWFCDDQWRFESFSRLWTPCFNWVVTTTEAALPKYEALGFRNVIKSQWACNHFLYRKLDLPLQYDVTFVGQPHGNRREILAHLKDAGIKIQHWGTGWESGRLEQEKMIQVFNQSRINLSLPNTSIPIAHCKLRRSSLLPGFVSRALNTMPQALKGKPPDSAPVSEEANALLGTYGEQIKGRNFEIPGCGGFLLTGRAENLEAYYEIGNEVTCFEHADDLVSRVLYFLRHGEERRAIAQAGYERTLREHTYAHRFDPIFRRLGLPSEPLDMILQGEESPGLTEEVH